MLLYFFRVCQSKLHAVSRSLIGILMALLVSEPRTTAGFLFRCHGESGRFLIFDCSILFCFSLIEFHCTFSISFKYYHIMLSIIVFMLGSDLALDLALSFSVSSLGERRRNTVDDFSIVQVHFVFAN